MKEESIGKIFLGLTSQKIIELLGKAEQDLKVFFSEVDGSYNQLIKYPSLGIELNFILDADSIKTVSSILIEKPCSLKTS